MAPRVTPRLLPVPALVACVWLAAAGLGAVAAARAEPASRHGKVVRVERPRQVKQPQVLLCPMPFADGERGVCYGRSPALGDHAAIFNFEQNYIGDLRVTELGPSRDPSCDTGSAFEFGYAIIESKSDSADSATRGIPFSIAIFGLEVDHRRSRLMTDSSQLPNPGNVSNASLWMGLDRDGDGAADLVVTAFDCSEDAPSPPQPSNRPLQAFCLDYWLSSPASPARFQHTRRDHVYTCL